MKLLLDDGSDVEILFVIWIDDSLLAGIDWDDGGRLWPSVDAGRVIIMMVGSCPN